MGTRSTLFIAIKPGIEIPNYLIDQFKDEMSTDKKGTIVQYEFNRSPHFARRDVHDLQLELNIHSFLLTMDNEDYCFIQYGDGLDHSGNWKNHPAIAKAQEQFDLQYERIQKDGDIEVELIAAAKQVVESWESSNVQYAVRRLAAAIPSE